MWREGEDGYFKAESFREIEQDETKAKEREESQAKD